MLQFASVAAEFATYQWRWRGLQYAGSHVRKLCHPSIRAFGACASTCTDAEFSAVLAAIIDPQIAIFQAMPTIPGFNSAETVAQLNALKTCKLSTGKSPCFPSEALVTMADGTPRPLSALRAGDAIIAASADGTLTNPTHRLTRQTTPEPRDACVATHHTTHPITVGAFWGAWLARAGAGREAGRWGSGDRMDNGRIRHVNST